MYKITNCIKCDLAFSRKQIVNGFGNPFASIVFIGEAPGATENRYGTPFIGKSGKLLRVFLKNVGFTSNLIYITNVIKCKPPQNRTPSTIELCNCKPHLIAELNSINPAIVVLLGATAIRSYFNIYELPFFVSKLAGKFIYHQGRIVFFTYHPSHILQNPDKTLDYYRHFDKIKWIYKQLINPLF
jgi:DNA polymerase